MVINLYVPLPPNSNKSASVVSRNINCAPRVDVPSYPAITPCPAAPFANVPRLIQALRVIYLASVGAEENVLVSLADADPRKRKLLL